MHILSTHVCHATPLFLATYPHVLYAVPASLLSRIFFDGLFVDLLSRRALDLSHVFAFSINTTWIGSLLGKVTGLVYRVRWWWLTTLSGPLRVYMIYVNKGLNLLNRMVRWEVVQVIESAMELRELVNHKIRSLPRLQGKISPAIRRDAIGLCGGTTIIQ
jgi:hypothetical protein